MSIYAIPIRPVPLQRLNVLLGDQACRINIRQRRTGIFLDLYEQDRPVIQGVKALNLVRMIRDQYLDFSGDLFFADTQGKEDPKYDGLGTRWILLWDTDA